MSLGLPAHLAPRAVQRSFEAAQHAVAGTLLSVAILMALVFQSARPPAVLWPSFVALLPAIGLLIVVEKVRPALWTISYLAIGGIGIHLYALTMLSQSIPVNNSDGFTFLAVKVALIMVGGVTIGFVPGFVAAIAGYLVGELAVGLALVETGTTANFDVSSLLTLLVTLTIIPLIGRKDPRQRWVVPRLERAAHAEHVASLRYGIEVKAATLMHDTVLSHLAAIADSDSDTLDPALRSSIRQDVDSLAGEEWLTTRSDVADQRARIEWQQSGLSHAIQEARLLGIDVTTTGDLASVGRLNRETSIALGLAVKQCLVNVLKHSGVREAEVAIYRSDGAVSVMVVDTGRGFVEAATGADRLGLRSSVRKRIELVGGEVNVWSAPGRGTSIMIKVPTPSIGPGGATVGET